MKIVEAKKTPNPDLIMRLEEYLEEAKSGGLKSLSVVGELASGEWLSFWFLDGDGHKFGMLGAMENLKIEFQDVEFDHRKEIFE